MTIENTSDRDPLVHLAGIDRDGQSDYITGMEADGQRQLVHSDMLPAQAPWAELEALGFVKGEPVSGDDLFVHCSLPEGWSKDGTEHSMHSNVLDERGIERVGVFYKAAFYDRRADASLTNPGGSRATKVIWGDGPIALPGDWDLLTEEERASFWASIDRYAEQANESPSYADRKPRIDAILVFRT